MGFLWIFLLPAFSAQFHIWATRGSILGDTEDQNPGKSPHRDLPSFWPLTKPALFQVLLFVFCADLFFVVSEWSHSGFSLWTGTKRLV
jgi:hypothetical protein